MNNGKCTFTLAYTSHKIHVFLVDNPCEFVDILYISYLIYLLSYIYLSYKSDFAFSGSPSGKIILNTKKKITIETPPVINVTSRL